MENQAQTSLIASPSVYRQTTSLYQLVNKLQLTLLAETVIKKSFIINDIDKSVAVNAEEDTLAYVVGSLLANAVYSTSDCCIRVETVCMAGQLQLRISSNSAYMYGSYIHIAGKYVAAAKKIGGNIGLDNDRSNGITIIFSLDKTSALAA